VKVSQPGDELRPHRSNVAENGYTPKAVTAAKQSREENGSVEPETETDLSSSSTIQPRRFHLTRSSTPDMSRTSTGGIPNRKKATKGPVAMFVERNKEGRAARKLSLVSNPLTDAQISQLQASSRPSTPMSSRPLKKPGQSSRVPSASIKKVTNPPDAPGSTASEVKFPTRTWDTDSDDLAAQMHAFTMQEIGRSIAAANEPPPSPARSAPGTPNRRFQPKPPAQRYHERHPEESSDLQQQASDTDADMNDESQYVIDTYIRVSGESLNPDEMPVNFGLLVIDSGEIAQFYGDDYSSDDDIYDEEEDENGMYHTIVLW
jgi:hypothetical protein